MDSEKVELLPCCKGLQIKQFYTGIEKKQDQNVLLTQIPVKRQTKKNYMNDHLDREHRKMQKS